MAKKPAKGRGKAASETNKEIVVAPETAPDTIEGEATPVEDAEVVTEADTQTDDVIVTPPPATDEGTADDGEKEPESPEVESVSPDVEPVASSDFGTDEPAAATEETNEPPQERDQPSPVAAAPAPRQSVFIPMLLGGLVAGGIGYGVAYYQYGGLDPEVAEVLNEYSDSLLALEERVTEIPAEFNAAPLAEAVSGLEDRIAQAEQAAAQNLAALDERINTIERQPSADGTLQETAVAAFERDLEGLREQIAEQQAEMRAMTEEASQQLALTREEAEAIEQNALAAADAATRRAALARIQGALESGAPYAPALAELQEASDQPVPEALISAADEGVPTLAALQADFPDISREALRSARAEGISGEEAGGVGSFLRNQFDVRSVAPQEGNSVDAILSRAEAALREGRLNDTLAEVAALPETVRATMTDWTARAEARAAALDAATTLSMQFEG